MSNIDLRQCDSACLGCVKSYKKKHDRDSKFTIVCNGIPLEYIPKNVLATIDNEEDAKSAIGMLDPVSWASQVLDWHCIDPDGEVWKRKSRDALLPQGTPNYYTDVVAGDERILAGRSPFHRPYQAELLRCTSKRKVLRLGRQCMTGDSLVYTPSGPVRADSIQEGQETLGGKVAFLSSHKDDIYQIHFLNGTSVKVNSEHPLYVQEKGWTKCEDLKIKDKVEFSPASRFDIPSISVSTSIAKLLGYLTSDGYWGFCQSVKFTNNNPLFLNEVANLAKTLFPDITPKLRNKGSKGFDLHLTQKHGSSSSNPIDTYLKDLGVYNKDSFGHIVTFDILAIQAFISGYFNGDGYLWHYERPDRPGQYRSEIGFAIGISEKKAQDFQFMLWRLGIHSIVKSEWMKSSTRPFYRVVVSRQTSQVKLLDFLDPSKYPEKFAAHRKILNTIGRPLESDSASSIRSIECLGKDTVYLT